MISTCELQSVLALLLKCSVADGLLIAFTKLDSHIASTFAWLSACDMFGGSRKLHLPTADTVLPDVPGCCFPNFRSTEGHNSSHIFALEGSVSPETLKPRVSARHSHLHRQATQLDGHTSANTSKGASSCLCRSPL